MRTEEEVKERLDAYMDSMYQALANNDLPNAERFLTMANLMNWVLSSPAIETTIPHRDRPKAGPGTEPDCLGPGDPPQTTIRCGNGETPFYGDILIR